MNKEQFFIRMRSEVSEFAIGRGDSSAFLIWFLENFFRLETQDAIDSVCDQINDKGIDGIYVDDEEEVIYLFQSKYSPNNDQCQGDTDIRNFVGASSWFENEESIQRLLKSTASRDLKSIVNRLHISEKTHYLLNLVFVTNKKFNVHATEYIPTVNRLETYDVETIYQKFTYFADDENTFPQIDLYLKYTSRIEYRLPDGTVARVYAIKANELIKLEGIQDRTLFDKNVRYSVGNTRVNKSIKATIDNMEEHSKFFLYHNGITIVCEELREELEQNKISLSGYAVINGCQSMLTFFENQNNLSNNLFVLVKIIQLNLTSPTVKSITYYANNQNSISLRDLRSNDSVQKSLQREFNELFKGEILYKRKRGESEDGYKYVVEKDFVAQIITAIYLKKPHNTHLKQKLFGTDYARIFSRNITAEKVYLGCILYDVVHDNAKLLEYAKIRNYGLSVFFFAYVLSEIMRHDDIGQKILDDPREYVTTNKEVLSQTLTRIWELMTPDINMEIEDYIAKQEGFFDYKNLFKNSQFVESMARRIKSDYVKQTRRRIEDAFFAIYTSITDQ